jgi:hypothetical protein
MHMHKHIHIHIHMHMHTHTYTFTYAYTYTCTYTHTHTHTYTYTYTYTAHVALGEQTSKPEPHCLAHVIELSVSPFPQSPQRPLHPHAHLIQFLIPFEHLGFLLRGCVVLDVDFVQIAVFLSCPRRHTHHINSAHSLLLSLARSCSFCKPFCCARAL